MSENFKSKYEVVQIIRDNILMGLKAFGQPVREAEGNGGWDCIESDQQSFKNVDKTICINRVKTDRVGWQSAHSEYNRDTKKFATTESFIEQQEWQVRIILKRNVEPVDGNTVTTEDIAAMLTAWFNRMGCAEFRKHHCANLFVQSKDIKVYKDTSDVSQMITSFPLKLQVPKAFCVEEPSARPEFKGIEGI